MTATTTLMLLALSGGGRPPRGRRPYDVSCETRTLAAPEAAATAPLHELTDHASGLGAR